MTPAPELSACPFCGGEELRARHDTECYIGGYNWIALCKCGACGPNCLTKGDAIAAWNRRAAPPALAVREPVAWPKWEPPTQTESPIGLVSCPGCCLNFPVQRTSSVGCGHCGANLVCEYDHKHDIEEGVPLTHAAPDFNPQADQQTGSTGKSSGCDGVELYCTKCHVRTPPNSETQWHRASCEDSRSSRDATPLTQGVVGNPSPTPPESRCKDEITPERIATWRTHLNARIDAALPQEAPAPSALDAADAIDALDYPAAPYAPPSALDVAAILGQLREQADTLSRRAFRDSCGSPDCGIASNIAEAAAAALEREHARANAHDKAGAAMYKALETALERAESAERERALAFTAIEDYRAGYTQQRDITEAAEAKVAALERERDEYANHFREEANDHTATMDKLAAAERHHAEWAVLHQSEIDAAHRRLSAVTRDADAAVALWKAKVAALEAAIAWRKELDLRTAKGSA